MIDGCNKEVNYFKNKQHIIIRGIQRRCLYNMCKCKVNLTKQHDIKNYEVMEVRFHAFLTFALSGSESLRS
jgi:hypothetical protein